MMQCYMLILDESAGAPILARQGNDLQKKQLEKSQDSSCLHWPAKVC